MALYKLYYLLTQCGTFEDRDDDVCSVDRLSSTLFSLFWSMFGLIGVDSVEIKYPSKERNSRYTRVFPTGSHATSMVETVGMFLFALYHVSTIIVLINIL